MLFGQGAQRRTGWLVFASTWFLCCGQSCVFPHLTRYYDLDLHLNDWQIGLMMSMTSLGAVFMQPLWGILADRLVGRTKAFRLAVTLNIVFLIFFAFSYQIGGFALLLPAGILFFTCYSAALPLNSSIILSYLGKQKRHLFGRIRVAGSISFTIGMFVICPFMVGISEHHGLYGRTLLFLTACGLYFLTILSTFWDERHFEKHNKPQFHNFLALLKNKNLLVFYLSVYCVSIGASAGIQYIGPYIGHRGLPERFFSTFWMIGVSVEIILTYNLHHIARIVGLKRTIAIGFGSEFFRWCGISLLDAPGWILVFSCFHGPAVLGVFFASAMYLDAECEESVRSTAQALLYIAFVFGQVTGYTLASVLVNHYSYLPRAQAIQSSFFWFSLFALAASTTVFLFVKNEAREN